MAMIERATLLRCRTRRFQLSFNSRARAMSIGGCRVIEQKDRRLRDDVSAFDIELHPRD
jgi:hypothetical protein